MAKNYVRDNVPLSRFGVLVAQLESIVASAAHKPPDPLLCFDLLSDLISAIDEEPKESILLWQRKCEDALYSLLVLGARRPVRHLASVAMAQIILKGDGISIYSRASALQGFLSDAKKNEPLRVAGATQCLGELYCHFGRRITSGLLETTVIVAKLMKFNEDFVRQEALHMLQSSLEGSGGNGAASAYTEAYRVIMRLSVADKSFTVRIAAARCLKAFANIGGPGLGDGELESSSSSCVKALEDPVSSVRDAFAEALGALLALGMNPDSRVQARGKGHLTPKKLEGCLQRHLSLPFVRASGPRMKELRFSLALSWVYFLQAIHLKFLQPDSELQKFAVQVMEMLQSDTSFDAQALACVLYILRVGVTDQMSEPSQREFLGVLGKQLQSPDATPLILVSALRTVSYVLKTLGEVPLEFKGILDNTIIAALCHQAPLVRVEAALTLRTVAEVDPTCVGGLISYSVTMLSALRENISFEKGTNIKGELESLHGQAAVLAALISVSPKLPLGYPSRLPKSVLEISKKMLMESSRSPTAAAVEKEAGWMLLSSLLSSMPKEELEDQVFDILALWASLFSPNAELQSKRTEELISDIRVWSSAVEALSAFIKCFVSLDAVNKGIFLQPVLLYLNRALSYISVLVDNGQTIMKPAIDEFIIRTLIAYQSLSDPSAFKSDHARLIQICETPFRNASKCEESSCLRMLLDKRDSWLGPWTPGRDWFEDELRSFQGGKDGILPCIWEEDPPSFPQPETISKTLVNQMLLCFGTMFASQDSGGMLSLLAIIEQCLKAGKKQSWHSASVTNICVGLLAGLKALLVLRPEPLGSEILSAAQTIFQNILAEGDICASQRRASSEGLGLLARLGNDVYTARLTRLLLSDVNAIVGSHYAASVALALGCIHCSAGGMALSSLVPATVASVSSLAKSSNTRLQIWSLHGLLLTIEAAGLSFVSHVQTTLGLAMDILLSEENGTVDLQQGVGRLINAIVAVLGPELAPGSIFFSRCKSVIAEISSRQETETLFESVRFTQQLVLFAPQAVTVHTHVQTLLPTLSARQPTLRHLALSTLRHLIEKDPVSVIDEQIEDTLFHMLDEETDTEIGSLAQTTIMRLLYASCPSRPSHWISLCRIMILATSSRRIPGASNNLENESSSGLDGDTRLNFSEDDEDMVSSARSPPIQGYSIKYPSLRAGRDKHLRYRTRVFAAECLGHLPEAVGKNPAHFDLSLAKGYPLNGLDSGDLLVLQLQELISLAYQISTIQFEDMRPIGVTLLSTIVDKFEMISDPELPGHLLLEQYQAQLVSAVRTALDPSSGPVLLEAGLQLATKILTSGIISGDQVAVKRIFSLISRPLDDFNGLYYPSFAEWVSCKIKIRLLTAHASLKCYTYTFLRRQKGYIPDEYLALLPLFSKSSKALGVLWISVLKDYSYVLFHPHTKDNWKPFLGGIQSSLVSSKLRECLEEAWPLILQAVALDAVPIDKVSPMAENVSDSDAVSGYNMVQLMLEEFQFLWGFSLLILFQGQDSVPTARVVPVSSVKSKIDGDTPATGTNSLASRLCEIVLPVFQFLSTEKFFNFGFLTIDTCTELLQVFSYFISTEDTWDSLAFSVFSQIVQNCPKDFLEVEDFAYLALELCLAFLFKLFPSSNVATNYHLKQDDPISAVLVTSRSLLKRVGPKMQLQSLLAFHLLGYKCIRVATTDLCISRANEFVQFIGSLLQKLFGDTTALGSDSISQLTAMMTAFVKAIASLVGEFIESIHQLGNKRSNSHKLLLAKLAFCIEQVCSFVKLASEIEHPGQTAGSNHIISSILSCSIQCLRAVLSDSDIQVQAIGLQVLKGMLQRGTDEDCNSFLIFIIGELIGDILNLIQKYLEMTLSKEAVAIVGECLKFIMLLQAKSKNTEFQKGLMNLLLEAIFLVFAASDDYATQDAKDLRSAAIKLVSQLAQIPSSAVYFKDALLALPIARRQLLQDIIRSSLVEDQNPLHIKSTGPSLMIRLPAQTEKTEEKNIPASTPTEEFSQDSDDEEDDDWDTFQSFPASTNEYIQTSEVLREEPISIRNSPSSESNNGKDDPEDHSSSSPIREEGEIAAKNEEAAGEIIFDTCINEVEHPHGADDDCESADQGDAHLLQDKKVSVHDDSRHLPELRSAGDAGDSSEPGNIHDEKLLLETSNQNKLLSDNTHLVSDKDDKSTEDLSTEHGKAEPDNDLPER